MERPIISNMRAFALAYGAALVPALLGLAALVATDRLAPGPALLAAAGIAAVLLVVIRPYLNRLERARRYADLLARGQIPPDPIADDATDLLASLRRLGASWAERTRRLEELVATNRIVTDAIPFPLLRLTERRRVVASNHAARELLGEAIDGHDISAVIRHPEVTAAADAVLATRDSGHVRFDLPLPRGGSFFAHIVPLERTLSDGTTAVIVLHDITDLKRAEEMRADFVANASHELRTPLTSFAGYLETLLGPAKSDEKAREKFIEIMRQQAARMVRLVDDLLSLSEIELLERDRPKNTVKIENVIKSVVEFLQPEAQKRGMRIASHVVRDAEGRSPAVAGDGDQLAQVFQNLIDNAIKYGSPDTPIEIRVAYEAHPPSQVDVSGSPAGYESVAVSVIDQGPGIPATHIPRLTERFYRVDQARSRAMGGTGLGLAIVKHIVSRHRGALTITSELGKGSCFTVHLPGRAPA